MEQPVHTLLAGWESFYVIAGSVAGTLIGLQFVVIALIADSRRRTTSPEIAAFGTPTVLHFCAALLLSALLSVPWASPSGLQFTLVAPAASPESCTQGSSSGAPGGHTGIDQRWRTGCGMPLFRCLRI